MGSSVGDWWGYIIAGFFVQFVLLKLEFVDKKKKKESVKATWLGQVARCIFMTLLSNIY